MSLTTPVRPVLPGPPEVGALPGRVRAALRRRATQPRWVRPSLAALLLGTAVLYLWGLAADGWANEFYAAAAQAGSQSWKAWFFGSLDAGNSITVDKTPASLWVMGLSIRLFGLNSWALLVPQALMGVATVALVVAAVRRTIGRPGPALLAGAVMALTPVAVVMFRFDNPDALLTLLLTAAAYAVVRALDGVRGARWPALAGALIGFAFLAKMLQAFLVVPGFALAYLLLAPTGWGRRIGHLALAGVSLLVAGGWWVAIVQLWPASSRPYIGGSTDDSVLQLALGYNGLSRLSGAEGGPQSGTPGLLRLFGAELGGQIAWLLPAALLALVAGLALTARAPRTDRTRAGLAVWGGWLLVTGAVFSLMAGIFHAYYTVALAPAIAALVGIGAGLLWPRRGTVAGAALLATGTAVTTATSFVLLDRSPDFLPALRWAVLVGGVLATAGVALAGRAGTNLRRAVAGLAIAGSLAGPAAYSLQTVSTAHTGSMPSAGPSVAGGSGGPGGGGFSGGGFSAGGGFGNGMPPFGSRSSSTPGTQGTDPGIPGGTPGSTPPEGFQRPGALGGAGIPGGGGGVASSAVVALLGKDAGSYTWVAATTGSQSAAGYQLATGDPVMAIGGFNGSDDSPTLAQFRADVTAGKIHYYIVAGRDGGQGSAAQIASWVAAHYTARTVDGVTVYDLGS